MARVQVVSDDGRAVVGFTQDDENGDVTAVCPCGWDSDDGRLADWDTAIDRAVTHLDGEH